jgi:hypothetical protein
VAPELAVQIVNYDTAAYLEPCLESLLPALADLPVPSRVLVLDNASSDDLSALSERYRETVAFSRSAENLGFGGGHNRLAREHDAALLCVLNPDVVLEQPDVLVRLIRALDDPGVVAAGPLLLTPEGAPQRFDHGELRGLRARVANGAGHAHWRPRDRALDVAWVSGAFCLLRRAPFDAAGGFDEGFFLYKEEEDLCRRLRRAGGRVRYVPEARARHVGSVVAGRDPALLAAADARYRAKHVGAIGGRALGPLYRHVTRRF